MSSVFPVWIEQNISENLGIYCPILGQALLPMILSSCLTLASGSGGPAPVSSYPSAPASPYGAASYGQGSYGQGSMAPVRAASPGAPAAPGLHTAYAPTETETRRRV